MIDEKLLTQEKEEIVDLVNNLLTIPPGFERGMQFEEADLAHIEDEPKNIQVTVNLFILIISIVYFVIIATRDMKT